MTLNFILKLKVGTKRKLKSHDFEITKADIKKAFKESLIITKPPIAGEVKS